MMKRPYIGITFRCCNVYARVYPNREGTAYEGTCPRCYRRRVRIPIVRHGGSKERFFETG